MDLPEDEMEKLIRQKNKTIFAYPATKSFTDVQRKKKKETYEKMPIGIYIKETSFQESWSCFS